MKHNYKLPESKKDKIELLKDIAAGKKTISDIMEKEWVSYEHQKDGTYLNKSGEVFTAEEIKKRCAFENTILMHYDTIPHQSEKPFKAHYDVTFNLS